MKYLWDIHQPDHPDASRLIMRMPAWKSRTHEIINVFFIIVLHWVLIILLASHLYPCTFGRVLQLKGCVLPYLFRRFTLKLNLRQEHVCNRSLKFCLHDGRVRVGMLRYQHICHSSWAALKDRPHNNRSIDGIISQQHARLDHHHFCEFCLLKETQYLRVRYHHHRKRRKRWTIYRVRSDLKVRLLCDVLQKTVNTITATPLDSVRVVRHSSY